MTATHWLRDVLSPLLLCALCGLLYAVTRPVNRTEAEDAFLYSHDVERVTPGAPADATHLIYRPVGRVLYRTAMMMGFTGRSHAVLSAWSWVSATCSLLLLYLILVNRAACRPQSALIGTAFLGACYGFWRYACEAEVYAPATAATLSAILLVTARSGRGVGFWSGVVVAACAVWLNLLCIIPLLIGVPIYLLRLDRQRETLRYVCAAALFIAIGYVVAAVAALARGADPVFVLSGTPHSPASIGALLVSPLKGVVGLALSVVPGLYLFIVDACRDMIVGLFGGRMLDEEIFLGMKTPASALTVPLATLAGLMGCGVVVIALGVGNLLRHRHVPGPEACGDIAPDRSRRAARMMMITWCGVHAVVVCVHEPGNPENWVLLLPAVIVLLTMGLVSLTRPVHRLIPWALVVLLFVHSYTGGIRLLATEAGDYNRQKSGWLIEHAAADDLLVTGSGPIFARHLRYHTRASVFDATEESVQAMQDAVISRREGPGEVWVTADLVDPPFPPLRGYPVARVKADGWSRILEGRLTHVVHDVFGGIYRVDEVR